MGGLFRLGVLVFQRLTLFGNLQKFMNDERIEDGKNDYWSNSEKYFTDHQVSFENICFRHKEIFIRLPNTDGIFA